MGRKIRWILIGVFAFIFGYCLVGSVFAGGVTDTNNGSVGDILVHSGITNGANDRGTWKDSSTFKGDKGDTGDTGNTGSQGVQGDTGSSGADGVSGTDGANGVEGKQGKKGNKGEKGKQGKGLKNRVNIMVGVQHEGKKWIKGLHGGYDVNNNVSIVEARFTRKIGKSYTDKRFEELQERLDRLEEVEQVSDMANLNYAERNYNIEVTEKGTRITSKF